MNACFRSHSIHTKHYYYIRSDTSQEMQLSSTLKRSKNIFSCLHKQVDKMMIEVRERKAQKGFPSVYYDQKFLN